MSTFKPLLAYTVKNPDALRFPVLVSPKLDGIRCVIHNDQPVSRTLKPIPNRFIQSELGFYPPFDGELMVGDPLDPAETLRALETSHVGSSPSASHAA